MLAAKITFCLVGKIPEVPCCLDSLVVICLISSQNTANLPYLLTFDTTGSISDPVPPPATGTNPNYPDARFTACKLGEAFAKINLFDSNDS